MEKEKEEESWRLAKNNSSYLNTSIGLSFSFHLVCPDPSSSSSSSSLFLPLPPLLPPLLLLLFPRNRRGGVLVE